MNIPVPQFPHLYTGANSSTCMGVEDKINIGSMLRSPPGTDCAPSLAALYTETLCLPLTFSGSLLFPFEGSAKLSIP